MLKKWVWVTVLSVIGIVALGFGGWALIDHYQYSQLVDQPSDVKRWEADPRPLQSKSAAIKQIKAIGQSDPLEKREKAAANGEGLCSACSLSRSGATVTDHAARSA